MPVPAGTEGADNSSPSRARAWEDGNKAMAALGAQLCGRILNVNEARPRGHHVEMDSQR